MASQSVRVEGCKLKALPGVLGTLPLSEASMTAFASSLSIVADTRTRVDSNGLFDDLEDSLDFL